MLLDRAPREIVWLAEPGAGGGGGGGGNQQKEPIKKAELPGKEKITVPVDKPPEPAPFLRSNRLKSRRSTSPR